MREHNKLPELHPSEGNVGYLMDREPKGQNDAQNKFSSRENAYAE
jgi:hypothetical protein